MTRAAIVPILVCAACALRADFSYSQTTRIGGVKKASSSVRMIKGNRMAQIEKDQVFVIDLDKENVTQIDLAKKTFYVLTFAQLKQAPGATPPKAAAEPKISVEATGKTRNIGMLPVKETVLTVGTDYDVKITVDSWMATAAGYDEVRAFARKLGEKLGYSCWLPTIVGQPLCQDVTKAMSKIDGAPVESKTTAVSEPNGQSSEATVDLSNLSSAPLDASKFDVPPGFKQIQPDAHLTGVNK